MITLHRKEKDQEADQIEQKFKDLVLAYRVETMPEDESGPYIVDSNEKIEGEDSIITWLRNLEKDLGWQRSLTGDACFLDPDSGEVC